MVASYFPLAWQNRTQSANTYSIRDSPQSERATSSFAK